MIIMVISIVTLAQASPSYILRMLRNGVFVLLAHLCLGIVAARAQNASWLFSPGSRDWNAAANWAPATVPTGTATFGASNTTTITFSGLHTSVGTLQFNAGAPAYSFNLSGFALTITGTGIVNNSSNRPTFTTTNGGGTEFVNTSTAGTAIITTNIGALTFFHDSSTAGSATITNNFDAATVFVNTSTAGTATIITNNRGATDFVNTSTAGTATITTNDGGGTFFNDSSTGGQARFITNAAGIFDISSLSSVGMTAGSIEGAGTYRLGSKALTVGLNNLSTEVSGSVVGMGGALIKVGTGTLTLTGTNTYSGGTDINGGILAVNSDANLGSAPLSLGTGPLSFNGGTLEALGAGGGITSSKVITLNAGGGTFLADAGTTSTLNGAISGVGSLTKDGLGTLALTVTLTGTSTYSGGTNLTGGILAANSDGNLGIGPLSFGGGTLEALAGGGGITSSKAVTLNAGGGTFLADARTTSTLSGAISGMGAFTKNGAGTLTLTGDNTYSGGTTISAGTLQARSTTAFSPNSAFTVNSVLDLYGNSNTVGSLAGNVTVTNNGGTPATLTAGINNSSTVFSGTLSDGSSSLGFTKTGAGTMILTGGNTYTGGTTINAGVLQIGNRGLTGSIASNVTDNGSLIFNRSDNITFNPIISGSGKLAQNGSGTIILGGTNTYSGGTIINDGTLLVNNSGALGLGNVVVNGGVLGADPQPINVKGNYTQNAGGALRLQVAGANPGQYDSLNVGGNATLGGTLQLISLAFQPKTGNQLTLVTTSGVVSGRFAQFVYPFATGPGFNTVELVYGRNSVLLEFLNVGH